MTRAFGAFPEFRHPFEATPIHPDGSITVLYQGKAVTLSETGKGPGLLIRPDDLRRVNGFEVKPQGVCFEDMCIPMTKDLLVERDGRQWFDLAAFAEGQLKGYSVVAEVLANMGDATRIAQDAWDKILTLGQKPTESMLVAAQQIQDAQK